MGERDRPPIGVFTPTPVESTNIIGRMEKLDRLLTRVGDRVEELPAIKQEVEHTAKQVVALDTKLEYVRERIGKAEDKIEQGHQCKRTSTIEQLKAVQVGTSARLEAEGRQSVKTLQMVHTVTEDHQELENDVKQLNAARGKARADWVKSSLGIGFSLLMAVGSGIWFVSKLEARVERNETTQREQTARIHKKLEEFPTRVEQQDLRSEVRQLRVALERQPPARYDDISALCQGKTAAKRRMVRRQLQQLGLNVPGVCREE